MKFIKHKKFKFKKNETKQLYKNIFNFIIKFFLKIKYYLNKLTKLLDLKYLKL